MKRIALSLLTLFALLAIPLAAQSGGTMKLKVQDLQFHTTLGDAFSYSQGDSFQTTRGTGLESSDEQRDTTVAIPWAEWCLPGPVYNTTVAADTIGALLLVVAPEGTSPTVAADTLDLIMQVSWDRGTTWTSVVHTGPAISPDVASMGAAAVVEVGSSNSFRYAIRVNLGGATFGGPFSILQQAAPTAAQTYGGQIRFILRGDFTGKYKARLVGWRCAED